MSQSFDIVLSKTLSVDDVANATTDLTPFGLRVDVQTSMDDFADKPDDLRVLVLGTADPAWPCLLDILFCRDECNLGSYPDLRIATHFWKRFGTDALCGTYPFAGELDPHDPYWSLACINGVWHLASTAGTALMGPYTDGERKFPGAEPVRLVRKMAIPNTATA